VFTDLDGTLLDHHSYDCTPALPMLERLRASRVPVILSTSKTLSETRHHAQALGLDGPLITENGGAVCVPLAPSGESRTDLPTDLIDSGYAVSVSGPGYTRLKEWLHRTRTASGFRFTGFDDWTDQQVAEHTGLAFEAASRARERLATEPLIWEDSPEALKQFQSHVSAAGLRCVQGGRFYHVTGPRGKAEAMQLVLDRSLPPGNYTGPIVALGDGPNDRDMLLRADIAVAIKDHRGGYMDLPERPDAILTQAAGPLGWREAIERILRDHPIPV